MVGPRALVGLLLIALLAGCTGTQDGGDDGPVGNTIDPCPLASTGTSVGGFTVHNGNWSHTGNGGSAVCGEGEKAVNSLVANDLGPFTDFEAAVTFRMIERDLPEFDAGAGMVLHFTDDNNFQIVRYSPREQGWHLFTMTNGTRTKQDEASVTPPTTNPEFGDVVELRVRSVGGHVTAYDGTTLVIDYVLPAGAATSGGVGYFLRAQQAAEFNAITAFAL